MEQNKDQSGAAVRGEAVACKFCDGEGVIHTGIDEAPSRECQRCDGSGIATVSARAADAPSEPSELRQALIDVRHAIQFSYDSVGGIDKMPVMMHHDGTVVEFIGGVLKSHAADALDSQPTETWNSVGEKVLRCIVVPAGFKVEYQGDAGDIAVILASSQTTDGGVRNGRAELAKLLAGAEPGDAT